MRAVLYPILSPFHQPYLAELSELVKKNGFASFPVVDDEKNLVGIITGRDTRFVTDLNKTVADFMTPKARLVTVKRNASRDEIFGLMHTPCRKSPCCQRRFQIKRHDHLKRLPKIRAKTTSL
ncbi:CBS domain-containing protein [Pasteurella multocida]|uniref:CBS domain-containing protein n=1 Tax=Pasteurella multocida TaxID=747 RepID=UPI002E1AC867